MNFVIHHHTDNIEHYDLMIEKSDALLTWRIDTADLHSLESGKEIKAEMIKDHRKEFLTYQGAISGNRGEIEMYDYGEYDRLIFNEQKIKIRINGARIKGMLTIDMLESPFHRMQISGN